MHKIKLNDTKAKLKEKTETKKLLIIQNKIIY